MEPITPALPSMETTSEKLEIRQRIWGLDARTDSTVSFEEFTYWAKIEREEEMEAERKHRAMQGPWSFKKMIMNRFSEGDHHGKSQMEAQQRDGAITAGESSACEKGGYVVAVENPAAVTEAEWKTASRALRTASWGSIFFLITTDVLGWTGAPFVFASVGYGAGVALYIFFGICAGLSGYFLWAVFMALASTRFPMLSYADLFLRIFGVKARHFINVAQCIQMFCTVSVLILGNGMVISQLAGPGLCFIACMIIAMVVGTICGSIRSLQRLGWLCNLSVGLNVVSFIIIMVAAANYGIDYSTVFGSTLIKTVEPVVTFGGIPPNQYQQQTPGLASQFNAVDTMVYAYSGALLFVAFMAEMRHPMDFWKGMIMAQAFICCVYLLFGVFVYSQYGQYSAANIAQVIQPLSLQTVANVFSLLTGLIACVLYFNIGMKTVYIEVFQELFKFPSITTTKGRWLWLGLGPCYWITAFIVAASVPNLNGIVSFIGGLLGLNFTYSLPGMIWLGYSIKYGSSLPGEGFDPSTGITTRHDQGIKRSVRGFFKRWYLNIPALLYILAALTCSGMGTWAAVEGLIAIFGPGGTVATSFGCSSPIWG